MSADRSTESIIDLIYGDLSDDEARQMREDLADSAEDRRDLGDFESLLGRVREAMPIEEVSPSIHASIMDAARLGAQSTDNDRLIRRTAPEAGIWSRLGRGQASQIALVAAVLVAGLFVVRAVDRSESPLHAPAGNISSMEEAAPTLAARTELVADEKADPAAAAPVGGEGVEDAIGGALADQWTPEPSNGPGKANAAPPVPPVATAEAPSEAPDVAASLRKELSNTRERAKAYDRDERQDEVAPKAEPAAKPDEKPMAPPSTRQTAAKPAPAKDMMAPKRKAKRSDGNKKGEASSSLSFGDIELDQDKMSDSSSSTYSNSGRAQGKSGLDMPAPAPVPEVQAVEEKEQREYRAPANSISQVNEYFRNGDYGGTIRAADTFLETNKSASESERASAMFVKAQSLEKQGKYTEADRIYEAIQKNYPTFSSGEIDRARKEIQRKNVRKPSKRAKQKSDAPADDYAPAESSYGK